MSKNQRRLPDQEEDVPFLNSMVTPVEKDICYINEQLAGVQELMDTLENKLFPFLIPGEMRKKQPDKNSDDGNKKNPPVFSPVRNGLTKTMCIINKIQRNLVDLTEGVES